MEILLSILVGLGVMALVVLFLAMYALRDKR